LQTRERSRGARIVSRAQRERSHPSLERRFVRHARREPSHLPTEQRIARHARRERSHLATEQRIVSRAQRERSHPSLERRRARHARLLSIIQMQGRRFARPVQPGPRSRTTSCYRRVAYRRRIASAPRLNSLRMVTVWRAPKGAPAEDTTPKRAGPRWCLKRTFGLHLQEESVRQRSPQRGEEFHLSLQRTQPTPR